MANKPTKFSLGQSYSELVEKLNEIIDSLIEVDTALSASSANPVQNKVINSALGRRLSLGGGTLDDGAGINLLMYGQRYLKMTGNGMTFDMSTVTGGWAGNFVGIKDPAGDTTPMLGYYGGASGLTHIFMGGTYSDPFMKMTKAGQFSFKNLPTLGTGDVGSDTQPVWLDNGVLKACTYTLGKSVPSDAKFTDTTYSVATTSADGLMSKKDKSNLDTLTSYLTNYHDDYVDSLAELMAIFDTYPQGASLIELLADKSNTDHNHSGVYQPVGNYVTTDGDQTISGKKFFKVGSGYSTPALAKMFFGPSETTGFAFGNDGLQTFNNGSYSTMYINYYGGNVDIGKSGSTATINLYGNIKENGALISEKYALKSHTHSDFASKNHTHSGYAASDHTHSGYAASGHTHSSYALISQLPTFSYSNGVLTITTT